ncbi:putative 25S rRNA adenine-N(1) methyltransferase [Seiridium cardinale]|uniref:25S rRNA adenine-N(1) methyltransferase n=1 Tax=Seiridium cardinale TaxID=138064 RepID=A0ABR2XBE3_9PEZI
MAVKKKRPSRNLAHGRPPTLQKPKSISRQATKALINAHHVLEKRKAQAVSKGDTAQQSAIDKEISALGGIEKYQQASLQGQRNDRGGDSSRVLMEWLKPALPALRDMTANPLRMLEVGALSTINDCSKSRLFAMERIDLNSQGEGILQQDFMARPLPTDDSGRFDIISLSLVLNFVPDAQGRGNMLLRTLEFLRLPGTHGSELGNFFPSLFLVLPAPCVTNSRYMDESRLEAIMTSLGYTKTKSKLTQKLVYYLWTRTNARAPKLEFSKTQIRTGGSRNNFAIILHGSTA